MFVIDMGLKENFDNFNKQPNAIYYYITGLVAFVFMIMLLSNPQQMGESVTAIFSLLFWLLICYVCFKFCGGNRQQQQQQVVVHTGGTKMRVCSKCGMQNDVTSKFCNDCGYEFEIQNY
jgi:ribosomal protein L40E